VQTSRSVERPVLEQIQEPNRPGPVGDAAGDASSDDDAYSRLTGLNDDSSEGFEKIVKCKK